MTRKHFEMIAKALRDAETLEDAAYNLSVAFHDVNPRFDQVRFLEACGVYDK